MFTPSFVASGIRFPSLWRHLEAGAYTPPPNRGGAYSSAQFARLVARHVCSGLTIVMAPIEKSITGHRPVLLQQVVAGLEPRSGGRYLDGTFGGGGHTQALLQASVPDGIVLALDADPAAVD